MIAFVSLADYEALRESHKQLVEAADEYIALRDCCSYEPEVLRERRVASRKLSAALAAARKLDTPEGES